MLPCRTNQDCVSEPRQQQKSELLAISSSLDFHWFSVTEVERVASPEPGEPDDGGGQEEGKEEGKEEEKEGSGEGETVGSELVIDRLAVLKKKDLGAELRHFDCCESSETVVFLVRHMYCRSSLQSSQIVHAALICTGPCTGLF